jgi:hypothetical protein
MLLFSSQGSRVILEVEVDPDSAVLTSVIKEAEDTAIELDSDPLEPVVVSADEEMLDSDPELAVDGEGEGEVLDSSGEEVVIPLGGGTMDKGTLRQVVLSIAAAHWLLILELQSNIDFATDVTIES